MMNETMIISDAYLIKAILAGEKNLYTQIVRRHNQRLYRVGMSILNDEMEVEDAMQVAYINAYENLGKFEFRASFTTWLTRILINECFLRLRKKGKMMNMDDEYLEFAMQQQQLHSTHSPANKVLNAELKNILEDAVRKLPEIYRTVFVMREIENMNVAETQECLGINEVNVKVRLNRAKAMLRGLLNDYYKKDDILHFHLSKCDILSDKVMAGIKS